MQNPDEKLIPLLEISQENKEVIAKKQTLELTPTQVSSEIPLATISPLAYPQSPDRQIEENLSKKFEEHNQMQSAEKLVKSTPHYIITYFFDQLYDFEFQMKPRAWVYHIIICVCAITLLQTLRNEICSELPMIQILFVALLINFAVNYYILRLGNILPYIEDQKQNQLAKLIGISGLALIIIAMLTQSYQEIFQICFFSSWILAMAIEIIFFKFSINWQEIIFLILTFVGTLFVTSKSFFSETKMNVSVLAIVGSLVASVLLTFFTVGLKQINKTNFLTTAHIILLMILIFLPIFFPFAKIVPPTLWHWCFFILASVLTYLILILFIRSIQLQNPSKILLFLNLTFVAKIILELIQNKSTFTGMQYLGCIFIIGACLAISFVGENPDGQKQGQSFYFERNFTNNLILEQNQIEMDNLKK